MKLTQIKHVLTNKHTDRENSFKIPLGTYIAYNQTNKNVTDRQTDKHKHEDGENLTII